MYKNLAASHVIPILVGLFFALAARLAGQGTPGHFYHVNYHQVRPGQEKAYDSAFAQVVSPVLHEMVKRRAAVSYLLLAKVAGSGDYTNLVIVEVATTGVFQQQLDSAAQATLHRSWCIGLGTMPLRDFQSCAASFTPSYTRRRAKDAKKTGELSLASTTDWQKTDSGGYGHGYTPS